MLIEQLAEYLEQNYVGKVSTDIFLMYMSDSPDNQVMLRQYGGEVLQKLGDIRYDVQVMVRDTDVQKGYRRIMQVFDILCKESGEGIYLPVYDRRVVCTAKQYPFTLGYDDKNRHTWVFNLTALSKREVE